MQLWNLAALGKPVWDVWQLKEKLWIKWIHTYYIKGKDFCKVKTPTQASWVTQKVFRCAEK